MKLDQTEHQIELLKLLLPPDMFDSFDFIRVSSADKTIEVFLDEKYHKPEKYKREKLISKDYHQAVTIQDFPIRDRVVYLYVRCRRWTVESTGEIISSELDAVEKGTRYTKGFAFFLRVIWTTTPLAAKAWKNITISVAIISASNTRII